MKGPNTWGPWGWKFIHKIAKSYYSNPTSEQKEDYKNFFITLGKVLPCTKCSENYAHHLEKYPLTDTVLANDDNLLRWTIDIHNEVNKINNKKVYSYDEAINLINNNFNDSNNIIENMNSH